MSKRAILSLVTINVLIFTLGVGTFAWFTTSTTTANTGIESGRLSLKNDASELEFHKHNNDEHDDNGEHIWRPGEEHDETITINNDGNLPAKIYALSTNSTNENNENIDEFLKNMDITIWQGEDEKGTLLLEGTLNDFYSEGQDQDPQNFEEHIIIDPDNETQLYIKLKMKESAGNNVQGLEHNFNLEFHATQHDADISDL